MTEKTLRLSDAPILRDFYAKDDGRRYVVYDNETDIYATGETYGEALESLGLLLQIVGDGIDAEVDE